MTQIKMGLYNSQGFSSQSAEYKTKFIYKGDMKVQKFHTTQGFQARINYVCMHVTYSLTQTPTLEAHVKENCGEEAHVKKAQLERR